MLKSIQTQAIILMAATMLMTNVAIAAPQEKLALDKQGIKVWTSQVENSPMAQYRAETIFNTTIENAVGLILDTEYSVKWIPNVNQMKIIERNDSTGSFIAYMGLKLPFPLSNRDLVMKGEMYKTKDGMIVVKNKAIKDSRVPEVAGLVRIAHYEGDWTFQKLADNKVKVITRGFADPGGAVRT